MRLFPMVGILLLFTSLTAAAEKIGDRESILCIRDEDNPTGSMSETLLGFKIGPFESGARRMVVIYSSRAMYQWGGEPQTTTSDITGGLITRPNYGDEWPVPCVHQEDKIFCDLRGYYIESVNPIPDDQVLNIPLTWESANRTIDDFFRDQSYSCSRS